MSNPIVTIEMENGKKIVAELYPDIAPQSVRNFISLANAGFYNGLIFHRCIYGFMIQGGCPDGTGMGGPGYCIKGEFEANGIRNDLRHTRGVLSMARAQDMDSAGSQFFIMHKDSPHLDGQYAAFGMVIDVMDVVDEIASQPRNMLTNKPKKPQVMKSVTVDTQGVEYPEPEKLPDPAKEITVRVGATSPGTVEIYSLFPYFDTGLHRFRRGCGGWISGRRRLTAIKRAT